MQVSRKCNDPAQYDDLAAQWWDPRGAFMMLRRLAAARALVPAATGDAVLVDLGCGAGLLAPQVAGKGYRHVGVDITASALAQARAHGVAPAGCCGPGGLVVIDTIAATALARLVAIRLAERLPAVPKGIHDPDLLVDRTVMVGECARHGVELTLRGIAPSVTDLARWLVLRLDTVRMASVPTTAILFQAVGRKAVP
ncbi:MAG: 2-polyprenyl-3-methyl-5-hydroxy-6-metoxy,4-benzoquinol methylase [Pseudonocardia sp.]|nr:2-polyprenyl-3-methyl-5-hydroxy-6-metoxy,4-benzoquinol methylase [Pseudonocardia sp.]